MRTLRAFVFDLDDTLYPERAYVLSGFRAVAGWVEEHMAVPAEQCLAELRQLFDEGVRERTFDRWLDGRGLDGDGRVAQMVRVYREHEPRIAPFPGARNVLTRLGTQHQLGLLTDGDPMVQRRKVVSLDLVRYFDGLVFSGDLGPEAGKPSTRPFGAVLELLGVAGAEAAYVADNPTKDFLGARRVGMWTVRVRTPVGLYSHLDPPTGHHAPDVEIRNLRQVPAALARIQQAV